MWHSQPLRTSNLVLMICGTRRRLYQYYGVALSLAGDYTGAAPILGLGLRRPARSGPVNASWAKAHYAKTLRELGEADEAERVYVSSPLTGIARSDGDAD